MSKARIHILWQHKAACMLVGALLLSCAVQAQLSLKRQKYNDIAAKYKNEHAIYTDVIHKMEIKEDENGLVATTRVLREKLFISEKSLSNFNNEMVSGSTNYSYFNDMGAVAYLPDGNDYKAVKNTNKDGHVSLAYTGLKRNSITSTTFSITHEELHLLPSYNFSNDIPTLNSVLEVSAPKYVKMGFFLKGADTSMITRTVVEKDGKIIYRFTGTNVPANKNYDNVPSAAYYQAHVVPYIISFRLTGAKKDSVLAGSINDYHKFGYAYVKGLNQKDDAFLNAKTAELTKYAYSDRDKVQHIYDWVQKSFHYFSMPANDFEGFIPREADSVCKRMYGDCKDMSSTFYAMCRKAGVAAYYTTIGSDNKPYTHDEIQSERLYDHMICAVKLDGNWVFLDGTTHVMPLGANREDLQGKEACVMIDEKRCEVVKVPETPASVTSLSSSTIMNISAEGNASGSINKHFTGYDAWNMGEVLNLLNRKDERDEYIKKKMQSGNDKFLVKNYNIVRSDQGQKDIDVSANYTLDNYAVKVKKDYYVNMNVNNTFADIRVNEEDRNVPYYMKWKTNVKETVTLNVPKGWRVSYLPKPAKGSLNDQWNYSISYKKEANTVVLTKEYELKTRQIKPSQFEAHNNLVDDLKKQYKETVVLTAK